MWKRENRVYLPGALGDNLMLLPFALSCAGITNEDEIYPALELYMDLSRQHFIRGDINSQNAAAKVLGWEIELFKMQPYIKEIHYQPFFDKEWIKNQGILNTDYQRTVKQIDMGKGDIMWRNNCLHRNLKYWSADKPWLYLPKDSFFEKEFANKIVVSATPRYYNNFVTWRSLHKYSEHCVFVGTDADKEGFYWRTHLDIPHYKINNFVEMALIIKHCAFLIGTQSFPVCLAESMKSNRIIIQAPSVPDVIPHGGCGNAVIDEADFEITLELYVDAFLKK